ncbi:UNVERIFIED_CONTAM: Disease resistance protein RPP8 [Sesamum calycinum]|uniref:Disease resistance protein RPP8 n=1 Tax=Sesamum calycinum TaxID=2727403 RepID=A0AAW2MN97_9LAMI
MAAYAALVSLARTINLFLQNHYHSIFFQEYSQQISHLLEQSALLQAFLEEGDHGLQARITDVANEAQYVIRYIESTQIQSRLNSARLSQDFQLQRYQDIFSDVYQKLQKVTKGMDSVVEQVMKSAKDSSEGKDLLKHRDFSSASSSSGLLVPAAGKDIVVGFEDDLTAIKHRLCGQNSKLQVVPIFGMGGIGKTTLARNAYDDQLIMEHFQIRAWVKISQDYSIQEIISNLLVSIEPSDETQCNQLLEEKVYKGLKGMRYLIVLDDMWSTKAWDEVKMILPDDDNGSRIIMTTRLLDVARYVDSSSSSPPREMHFLDEDQSWNLLRQLVFKQEECPDELEKIGKLIARSCGGLPFAVVVIAGLLSTVGKTRASWENIAEDVNLAVTTNYDQFAKILSLSYINLPQHLRPCFLYMGGFPEDYEIHVWKLIKLWVAEGFIKPNGSNSLEEEAEEYLEDLVKRSLVLVTKRKTDGKIKICSVHDLVRDLCIRKAEEENFLHRGIRATSDRILGVYSYLKYFRIKLILLSNHMSSLAKQISVPIFSGQNYDYWAIKMKTYFQSQKLWEIVEEGVTLPEDSSTSSSAEKGKLENKKAKDSEALYYIQTAVADHIFPRISVATSAKEAWSILQKGISRQCKVAETGEATWYIDSAASNHMTYNKGAFQTLDESFKTNVKLGDNHIVKVEGKGSVAINTKKGTRIINDVMYIPNLRTNLFSVGQMMEKGYTLHFGGDSCTIYDNKDKTLKIAETYHKSKLSRELAKPVYKETTKKPFPSGTSWRAKAVLELIHTDVCGPMRTPSHEQNRYFILFIDDYSRMTWVYFMREKSEVFKVFKKFKNLVEKQSGRSIKVLRSDRGKEYNNSEFDKFCEEEGIEHQTTVSYNPQQNGVSERKNRTVMEMARSMLQEKHLPKAFWAEAVYTAVYLLNSRDVEFDEDAMWNWDEEKVERQSVMIPKETPPQQQQEEGTDQAEMERRSQQAPGSPRRPPHQKRLRKKPAKKDKASQ